jgi:hypothetical protein
MAKVEYLTNLLTGEICLLPGGNKVAILTTSALQGIEISSATN